MTHLVSICIPAYNCESFLADTLQSLALQKYTNWEAIVVNDGSTDGTLAVARRFESGRIKVIDQENAGQSAAENRAIAEAQGDFFVFLDADDFMSADKLSRQVAHLGDPSVPLMASCAWGRFHRHPERAEFKPTRLWQDLEPTRWLIDAWQHDLMMHGAGWLIPRPVLERSGGWNPALSLINDHEFFPRVMLQTERIVFTPEARTFYRSGFEGNLSGARSRRAWESAYQALELSTKTLLRVCDTDESRRACATKFQRFVYTLYPNCPDLARQSEEWVSRLGGATVEPEGGRWFHRVRSVIGWKGARRLEQFVFRCGWRARGMQKRWEDK
jgi:glycosyltransferase involved in cell wall biosynthesis